jgi:hypothetical protein
MISFVPRMTSIRPRMAPPGLFPRLELQRAVITMAATLGTFGSALVLERVSQQNLSLVVLSVVLALSLSRLPQGGGGRHRLLDLAVVPLVALCAGSVGQLLLQRPNLGAVAFIVAMTVAMWARQFGRRVARLARLLTLPVTSMLVVPAAGLGIGAHARLWQMAAALVAFAWVVGVQTVARWCRLLPPDVASAKAPALRSGLRSGGPARRLSSHTRMALQLAVALTAAFMLGRSFFPLHWNWTVLTATIVCGGGPSRGEVVMKGVARLIGAGVGTLVATALAVELPGRHVGTVVLVFVLLFVGSWWREIHYAAWAACVTCVMALLNSYLGYLGPTSTASLLSTRLLAIAIGAACATAACCLVFPVTTTSIVRRRRALALQALGDVLHGLAEGTSDLQPRMHQLELRALELGRVRRPLHLQQLVVGKLWPVDAHLLASTASVLQCLDPARTLLATATATPEADDDLRGAAVALAKNVGRTRQRLAGTPTEGNSMLAVHHTRAQHLHCAVLAITDPAARSPNHLAVDQPG